VATGHLSTWKNHHPIRRRAMGEKGSKKDREKAKKQKQEKLDKKKEQQKSKLPAKKVA